MKQTPNAGTGRLVAEGTSDLELPPFTRFFLVVSRKRDDSQYRRNALDWLYAGIVIVPLVIGLIAATKAQLDKSHQQPVTTYHLVP